MEQIEKNPDFLKGYEDGVMDKIRTQIYDLFYKRAKELSLRNKSRYGVPKVPTVSEVKLRGQIEEVQLLHTRILEILPPPKRKVKKTEKFYTLVKWDKEEGQITLVGAFYRSKRYAEKDVRRHRGEQVTEIEVSMEVEQ